MPIATLLILIMAGLMLALIAIMFWSWRQRPRSALPGCPACGFPVPPHKWPRHTYQQHDRGQNIATPLPTCPRCGFIWESD